METLCSVHPEEKNDRDVTLEHYRYTPTNLRDDGVYRYLGAK